MTGYSPAVLLSCTVAGLALPSAVLAFSTSFDKPPVTSSPGEDIGALIPVTVDQHLARTFTVRGSAKGQLFRFTPASSSARPNRSVTVAVRVDEQTARNLAVTQPKGEIPLSGKPGGLRIAPTAYSLGVSRGYQSFTIPGGLDRAEQPALADFKIDGAAAGEPSRLNARIALDEREKTGRAPLTLEGNGEQSVDVAGSYRLTPNLRVTAGVRYSQERDRLLPTVDGQKDAQAVYVGTQFRF